MKNKIILILGGTGALGRTLMKRYYQDNTIIVFSRDEHKHYELLKTYPDFISVIGDIKDKDSVRNTLNRYCPDTVINTAALKNPEIIKKAARRFGSQAIVLSIQAKRNENGWEAYFDNGREHSGIDAVDWASEGEELGAGEILVTSVDKEGMAKGFDCELIKEISSNVSIPVIASGGMGKLEHLSDVVIQGCADAVAMAHVLHYDIITLNEIRDYASKEGIPVRNI